MVLNKINTNDLLQFRNMALSLDIYVLCFNNKETHGHLFLHCPVAWDLWNRLLVFSGDYWVVPEKVEFLLTSLVGLGREKDTGICGSVWYSSFFGVWTK